MSKEWLSVSLEGLRAQAEEIGRARVIVELVSNSFDEDGVDRVVVRWTTSRKDPSKVTLVIEDNAPEGFRYLEDAYTLFAPSYKRDDPEKRGRFNLGEKWFLALCDRVKISSSTGSVTFTPKGRRVSREASEMLSTPGTSIAATLKLDAEELAQLEDSLRRLIVPEGVTLLVNDGFVKHRTPIKVFEAYLQTLVAEKPGQPLHSTTRYCNVEVYDPRPPAAFAPDLLALLLPTAPAEKRETDAWIYEMGIPVVQWPCRWSVNVMQKVPLNRERDSVTDGYRKTLLAIVANEMVDALDRADAAGWANEVIGSNVAQDATIRKLVKERFGDQVVAYDPSDKESNAAAAARGYNVVHGGSLSREQWARIKDVKAIIPAGQVVPTNLPASVDPKDPEWVPEVVPTEEWSDGMTSTSRLAQRWARHCGIATLEVEFVRKSRDPRVEASYKCLSSTSGRLTFVGTHNWYEVNESVADTIIHELAHHFVRSHHDEEGGKFFYDACSLAGAKIAKGEFCLWT